MPLPKTDRSAFCVLCLLLTSCFTGALHPETQVVGTQAELFSALEQIKAGETVQLASGTWEDLNLVLDMEGTEEAPIHIIGAADGSTVITGISSIQIGGDHIEIANLHFRNAEPPENSRTRNQVSQGVVYEPVNRARVGGQRDALVQFRIGKEDYAQHCRMTNCWFEDCNPADPDRRYMWVRLYGREHRIDHNLFSGMEHRGVIIQAVIVEDDAQHRIDHNHFLDRAPGDRNSFETIQFGHSYHSEKDGNSIIENNLFEACDGETEIISVKTCGNIIRGNIFYRSRGTLTLRHGDNNLVEGNSFLGENKAGAGGIRIIGRNHRVANNYFEGVSGTTGATIVIYTGIPDSPLNGYFEAHNAVVENNFIYNAHGNGIHLNGGYGARGRTLFPKNVTVANNLIHLSSNSPVQIIGELDDATLTGNVLAEGNETGQRRMEGFTVKKLSFERKDDGFLTALDETGSAVFEFSGQAPRLLERSEVGPNWLSPLKPLGTWNPDSTAHPDQITRPRLTPHARSDSEELLAGNRSRAANLESSFQPIGENPSKHSANRPATNAANGYRGLAYQNAPQRAVAAHRSRVYPRAEKQLGPTKPLR